MNQDTEHIIKSLSADERKFMKKCFAKIEKDEDFNDALKDESTGVEELSNHLARILGDKDYNEFLTMQKKHVVKNPTLVDKINNKMYV